MSVQTFKNIRESKKWTKYRMSKELGISQTQYDYLEKTAKSVKTDILLKLFKLSDLSHGEFWKLFHSLEGQK